jgi:hypothetical protein
MTIDFRQTYLTLTLNILRMRNYKLTKREKQDTASFIGGTYAICISSFVFFILSSLSI